MHADDLWLHTGANLASGDLGLDIKRFNSDLGDGQQARFSAQRELRLENSRGDAALAALPPAELNGTLLLQAKDISLGQGSTGAGSGRRRGDAQAFSGIRARGLAHLRTVHGKV